jgi:hypothetical protein
LAHNRDAEKASNMQMQPIDTCVLLDAKTAMLSEVAAADA